MVLGRLGGNVHATTGSGQRGGGSWRPPLTEPSISAPHLQNPDVVAANLGVEATRGLAGAQVAERRGQYGPNRLTEQSWPP